MSLHVVQQPIAAPVTHRWHRCCCWIGEGARGVLVDDCGGYEATRWYWGAATATAAVVLWKIGGNPLNICCWATTLWGVETHNAVAVWWWCWYCWITALDGDRMKTPPCGGAPWTLPNCWCTTWATVALLGYCVAWWGAGAAAALISGGWNAIAIFADLFGNCSSQIKSLFTHKTFVFVNSHDCNCSLILRCTFVINFTLMSCHLWVISFGTVHVNSRSRIHFRVRREYVRSVRMVLLNWALWAAAWQGNDAVSRPGVASVAFNWMTRFGVPYLLSLLLQLVACVRTSQK